MAATVEELYGALWGTPCPEFDEAMKESLHPRNPVVLYDLFGEWGVGPEHVVLDVGSRYADHSIALVKRFGCRAVAVDPVPLHREQAREWVSGAGLEDRIALHVGPIEALPLEDASVDFVWCRDMLNHVGLPRGLAECFRVLRPGGIMFVYQTFATEGLELKEAARLFASMAIVPENMSPDYFEATARSVGFQIVKEEKIDSEWREASLEKGDPEMADSLLAVARMRRREGEWVERFGKARYEAAYGGELWGIYQMLGKLCPTVYVLQKTG